MLIQKHKASGHADPIRAATDEAMGLRDNLKAGEIGAISIKLPLPPGALSTLWQNDRRFIESYMEDYPGYYQTGDAGIIDEDGYIFIMARTDDIINVAGHRLSTGGMEEVLAEHPNVAECAVIGVEDQLKGQLPFGFLVLNAGIFLSTFTTLYLTIIFEKSSTQRASLCGSTHLV